MSASTTKILMLVLFTGSLVSAIGRSKRNESKISGPNAVKLSEEEWANKYGALNDTLKDKIMEENDELYTNINNIETQKISDKVKNKKNGSDLYKMSKSPATKIPTKENIAQSQMKELKKNNAAIWSKAQEKNARKENNAAATKIQTLVREKLARNQLKKLKNGKQNKKNLKKRKKRVAKDERQEKALGENNAATKIQTLLRQKLARNRLKELKAEKENRDNVQLKVDDRAKHAVQAMAAKYAAGDKRRQEKAAAKN
jgi:hypothetical protein